MEDVTQKIYFEIEVTWDGGVNGYYSFDKMMEDTIHSVFAVRSLNDLILDARKHSVTDNIILCSSYCGEPLDQEEIDAWNDYIKEKERTKKMMSKEEMIKEHFNYLLEMHTNGLKALGTNGVLNGMKPPEIIDTIGYMDRAFRDLMKQECTDYEVDRAYHDFVFAQVTTIYKLAMEVTQGYYLHYHGIVSKEDWKEVKIYEESE